MVNAGVVADKAFQRALTAMEQAIAPYAVDGKSYLTRTEVKVLKVAIIGPIEANGIEEA